MLNSLIIKNFRSLEDFQVAKLGRVNLIVGKNNSGKSTVLEALRIYAGNAQGPLLETIAGEHDEKTRMTDSYDGDPDRGYPFQDLFTGRRFPVADDIEIVIGSAEEADNVLRIQHVFMSEVHESVLDEGTGESNIRVRRRVVQKSDGDLDFASISGEIRPTLAVTKGTRVLSTIFLDRSGQRFRSGISDQGGVIPCSIVPTHFISSDELADGWDKIALTESEDVVRQALRYISPDFESMTFIKNEDVQRGLGRVAIQRSAMVKLQNSSDRVPLNSLGDGILRVLQLALKIFPAKGGFLLIDEFENGLHYSVQEKIWGLIFEMAEKLNFQVFATTHSWDCIESFTKVAIARKDVEGVLFRVGKSVRDSDKGRIIATVFDEAALFNITQTEAEVR